MARRCRRAFRRAPPPRLRGLAGPVRDFALERKDFLAIIDGMEMDVVSDIRAPDLATLDLYCDRVASAVGRLCVKVFGMGPAEGRELAHHLGRALQLTNILRDLDEDAALGRLYLPREALSDCRHHGGRSGDGACLTPSSDRLAAASSNARGSILRMPTTIMARRSAPDRPHAPRHGGGLQSEARPTAGAGLVPSPRIRSASTVCSCCGSLRVTPCSDAAPSFTSSARGLPASPQRCGSRKRASGVIVHEAAGQAGGRCRSYFDPALDMTIDNGNHLLLSGNHAALDYLRAIGAEDRLVGPAAAEFPFIDLATHERWLLRPNEGRLPWWIFDPARRVPGTRAVDYLAVLPLLWAGSGKTIGDVMNCNSRLYKRLWHPLLLAALNTDPSEASAGLAASVVRETLLAGGQACRPLIARDGLAEAFVDPAMRHLQASGATVRFGHRLRGLSFEGRACRSAGFRRRDRPAWRRLTPSSSPFRHRSRLRSCPI